MMSDWVQSIFIVVMFSMFLMVDAFNGGVRSVQENWNMYRCNPVMMPFAGQFAPKGSTLSTQDNFSYCVQNMMSNFAPAFTQPFAHLQNVVVVFHVIIIKLIAAQGRTSAIMTTLMHVLVTAKLTFESMWNGIPGKMIQTIGKL